MTGTNWATGGEALAKSALIELTIAGVAFPQVWPLTGIAYKMQGDPGQMWDAGQDWFAQADKLAQAAHSAAAIQQQVGGLVWVGNDYDAYKDKSDDFLVKLTAATLLASTMGVAMSIAAIETFIAIMILFVVAGILSILAAIFLATVWFPPTEPVALEAQAMALEVVTMSTTILEEVDFTTQAVDAGLAAGIGAMLIGDVVAQLTTGDFDVLGDLGQATVDGLGTMLKGLLAAGYQEAVGAGFKYGGIEFAPMFGGVGLGEMLGGKTLFESVVGD